MIDLIIGASLRWGKWKLAAGYQQVLYNINQNGYQGDPGEDGKTTDNYFSSYKIDRGNDLMLRCEREVQVREFALYPGIMPVFRVDKDGLVVENEYIELDGSEGLTFNVTLGALYPISVKSKLFLNTGGPLLVRQNRADGLTRVFVAIVGWEHKF